MTSQPPGRKIARRRAAAATLAAAIGVTVAGGEPAVANTPDYFTGLDTANPFALDDPLNYSTLGIPPTSAVPTAANDAVIGLTDATLAAGATLTFNSSTATAQAFGSLNVNTSSAITIYNQVASTTVTLTLGGSTGNAYAPNASDLLFAASGTTLSINSSSTSTVYGSLPIALAQSGNFDVAGTAYVGSAISGAFGITKTGTGTLTLGASSSFTGGLTIAAGTVSIASSTYLGAATSVTTMAAGTDLSFTNTTLITGPSTKTFVLSGGAAEIDAAVTTTIAGVISGPGGLVKGGPGILTLSPETLGTTTLTSNTYTGGTTVASGTLQFSTQNALPAGTVTLDAGTSLTDINTTAAGTFMAGVNIALAGSATFNESTAAKTFTIGGTVTGTGQLTKAGAGTLYLTNAGNTYSGGTNISTGTLRSQNTLATGTGTVTINGGLLGGNGSVGAVVVNTGGTIGAGPGASVTGTLTTGAETWNTGGALLSKVGTAGTTSDTVVMSSLAFPAAAFTVNISNASTAAVVTSGTVLVLADDTDPAAANPFNASGTSPITLSALSLNVSSGVTFSTTTFALATQADTLGNGGFDLVLEDTAATPEPASLLLLGLAAVPLSLVRRQRRATAGPHEGVSDSV